MTPALHPPRSLLASRFALSYFALYFPFLPLDGLPFVGAITEPWNDIFTGLVPWISARVFHLPIHLVNRAGSRFDSLYGYERVACILLLAVMVTGVWCIADRRREGDSRPGEWLRVWLRFALANAMLYYGISKVTLAQFPYPSPEKLVEPFGAASPMGLLWAFMGYSAPYEVFTGGAECLAGLLLLFRRTATLGALVAVAAMSNVLMLNLCYDVPLKLYAFHLLVMGGLLVVPDARRLADVLVLHRATEPARFVPHVTGPSAKRALAWGKAAYLALLLGGGGASALENLRSLHEPRSPLYGIYEVESFVRDGAEVPPLLTDSTRWRRMTVSGGVASPRISIWSMNDERESFTAIDDPQRRTLSFESGTGEKAVWDYAPDGRDVILRGHLSGAAVHVKLRRVEESSLLLVSRGFRWASERMVNQ